jgi:hypothetical protein
MRCELSMPCCRIIFSSPMHVVNASKYPQPVSSCISCQELCGVCLVWCSEVLFFEDFDHTWVVSIEPRLFNSNSEKPQLYVSITKNHDKFADSLQCALILNWSQIDTKTDMIGPPVRLMWQKIKSFCWGRQKPHMSVQLKILNKK